MQTESGTREDIMVTLALTGLGLSLPLLDLFGRHPQFFVAKAHRRAEVVLFGVIISIALPAAAALLVFVLQKSGRRIGKIFTLFLHLGLSAALCLALIRKTPLQADTLILLLGATGGSLITIGLHSWGGLRVGMKYLAPAPLVSLAFFLLFSPSASLIWTADARAAPLSGIGQPAPIVLLIFDEFPTVSLMRADGSLNNHRFPNFARLARSATWYRNASSVSPWTPVSIPAALTGRIPQGEKPPISSQYPRTLFTLLGDSYRILAHEEITQLCPPELCKQISLDEEGVYIPPSAWDRMRSSLLDALVVYGHAALPPMLRARLPSLDRSWGNYLNQDFVNIQPLTEAGGANKDPSQPRVSGPERSAAEQAAWLEAMIASVEPGVEPVLYFTHVVLPHFPWEFAPDGKRYLTDRRLYDDLNAIPGLRTEGDHWNGDAFLVRQGLQRHLLQVGYMDLLVGKLIDRMQAVNIWEQTIVVITADHGVSFQPNLPRRAPTQETLDDIFRVPLFIKLPHDKIGRISDENVTLLDILPTLVDALDIHTDWRFEGRSLLGDQRAPREKVAMDTHQGQIPVSPERLFQRAAGNAAIFQGREDWTGIAAVGKYGYLVGRDLENLGTGWTKDLEWDIDQTPALEQFQSANGFAPLLITGSLVNPGGESPPQEVLVCLNGVVAGIGGGFECNSEECQFSALLAEEFLQEGYNQVDVMALLD